MAVTVKSKNCVEVRNYIYNMGATVTLYFKEGISKAEKTYGNTMYTLYAKVSGDNDYRVAFRMSEGKNPSETVKHQLMAECIQDFLTDGFYFYLKACKELHSPDCLIVSKREIKFSPNINNENAFKQIFMKLGLVSRWGNNQSNKLPVIQLVYSKEV